MNKKKILICVFIILLFFVCVFLGYTKTATFEIQKIKSKGVIKIGTTGDYKPMTFYNKKTGNYEGFDIALSDDLAKDLGVQIEFVQTTWPTLTEDTINNKFDMAISGITITEKRKEQALMSKGYIKNGKTILCRREDKDKYKNIESINKPEVKVMENPGGLNEKFARENLKNATLIIHNVNEEIPNLIATKKADVMITEILEAKYYANKDKRLYLPLGDKTLTQGEIGILLPKKNKALLKYTNNFIEKEEKTGRLNELKGIYIK